MNDIGAKENMGKMSNGLKRIFDQAVREKVVSLDAMKSAKQQASHNLETMPSVESLVGSGRDPQHAIYVNTLNLISLFGDEMSTLPPLHRINDFLAKWQDIYQPSFPPISPITTSYFTCWSLLDATFGVDKETVGTCFLSLIDRLPLDPIQIEAARNLDQSRMGIYQVIQGNGKFIELRELVTDRRITAYCSSGYKGCPGDILFVRLVPPLANTADYSVMLTTPYRLVMQSVQDWLCYFERHDIQSGKVGVETRLSRHMKYGKKPTYWSEYIFYGYCNYEPEVVFLTGFPDQPQTQPNHDRYLK
ncbi:hypothetical protein [Propionivibrio sp.]|uniref:hypothetical protein n=1 Tax=Propionivibrio sp. TaxID=2212460 RepID=UPI003BF40C91